MIWGVFSQNILLLFVLLMTSIRKYGQLVINCIPVKVKQIDDLANSTTVQLQQNRKGKIFAQI